MGDLDTHDDACRLLCEGSGMPLLSVAYRLAPEAPFPAAVDDALASARWALKQLNALGVTGLALGGDSAGANLAAVTAARLALEGQHVAAQLLIYPGTDLLQTRPSHTQYGAGYFLDRTERETFYGAYLRTFKRMPQMCGYRPCWPACHREWRRRWLSPPATTC